MQKILFSTGSVFFGFKYVFQNKWTWKYIFIAILVNIILFTLLLILFFNLSTNFSEFTLNFFKLDKSWLILLDTIAIILGFFLSVITFIFTANIANAPVYGQLAEKFLKLNSPITFEERSFFQEIFYSLSFELKKLLILIILLLLTFLVNFIPFIGQIIYFILTILQLILFAGFDFFDAYLSRTNLRFRGKTKYILKNPKKHFPFLAITGFLVTIPFLNIFLWPFFILSGLNLVLLEENSR